MLRLSEVYLNKGSLVHIESGVLDVDSVEELSQIFVGNLGRLVDQCAGLRHVLEVSANDSDEVLLLFLLGDGDSGQGIDLLVHLDSDEVLDFECLRLSHDLLCLRRRRSR